METSHQLTLLFTEENATSSLEASLANPTLSQAIAKETKTKDTSGQKCLEQYERFNPLSLWQKTFLDCLIGQMGEFSPTFVHRWNLKATKSRHLYFQLRRLKLRTKDTDCGLWPIPTTNDSHHTLTPSQELRSTLTGHVMRHHLPTPRSCMTGSISEARKNDRHGNLETVLSQILLPTVCAADGFKGTSSQTQKSLHTVFQTGGVSRLNPQFCLEMMGFPTDWTLSPFQDGVEKP